MAKIKVKDNFLCLRLVPPSQKIFLLLLASCFLLLSSGVLAADYVDSQYETLLDQAEKQGVAPVVVTLPSALSLTELGYTNVVQKTALKSEAEALLSELDDTIWQTGLWNNDMGQVGFYATKEALKLLANSFVAEKFAPDTTRKMRFRTFVSDGSREAIERKLKINNKIRLEVYLNVDAFEYDLDKVTGKEIFRPLEKLPSQLHEKLNHILSGNYRKGLSDIDQSKMEANEKPSFMVTVDREGYYGLRENPSVRTIKPVGFKDERKAHWPQDLLEFAKQQGNKPVDVIMTLRGGSIFSPSGGYMSETAWKEQGAANRRAFDDILQQVSARDAISQRFAETGTVVVRLNHGELTQLYRHADPRILHVSMNKPEASPSLVQSTNLINMPSAWNAGYTAAGQNIVVLDTGVRSDHAFLKNGNNQSKVILEACFGTNASTAGGITYTSICPSQNPVTGDSPLGLAGSAQPNTDPACQGSLGYNACGHGTHVAGIAAGRENLSSLPAGLQGVAPDASIIAAQVFSYGYNNLGEPFVGSFETDQITALQAVVDSTANPDPYNTVNMSLGAGAYSDSASCDSAYPARANLINNLISRDTPVVIAAGNASLVGQLGAPACISGAIKVGAVEDNGSSLTSFSNIADPDGFIGPILLAPGRTINSSDIDSSTDLHQLDGTSMAAPHVSGIYAAIKAAIPGISVADATAWIVNTGSIHYTYTYTIGPQTYNWTIPRVHIPNF